MLLHYYMFTTQTFSKYIYAFKFQSSEKPDQKYWWWCHPALTDCIQSNALKSYYAPPTYSAVTDTGYLKNCYLLNQLCHLFQIKPTCLSCLLLFCKIDPQLVWEVIYYFHVWIISSAFLCWLYYCSYIGDHSNHVWSLYIFLLFFRVFFFEMKLKSITECMQENVCQLH